MTSTARISMREFLRSGEFGPVRLGDSVECLRQNFGEAPVVGGYSRKRRRPGIWKYGDVEFHLTSDGEHIALIFCDTFEQLQFVPGVVFDRWLFEGHPAVELVERELASAGLRYEKRDLTHEPSVFLLRLDSGVELLFSRGYDPGMWPGVPGLFGFQFADKAAK
jgi:hypothetical protein